MTDIEVWQMYVKRVTKKRKDKISYIKILVASFLAVLFMIYLLVYDAQKSLLWVYVAWACFYLMVHVIYYILPNKEKWLVKPMTGEQIVTETVEMLEKYSKRRKETLLQKESEIKDLENSISQMDRIAKRHKLSKK